MRHRKSPYDSHTCKQSVKLFNHNSLTLRRSRRWTIFVSAVMSISADMSVNNVIISLIRRRWQIRDWLVACDRKRWCWSLRRWRWRFGLKLALRTHRTDFSDELSQRVSDCIADCLFLRRCSLRGSRNGRRRWRWTEARLLIRLAIAVNVMNWWQRWHRATSRCRQIIDRRITSRLRRIICVILVLRWHTNFPLDGFFALRHSWRLVKLVGLEVVGWCRRSNTAVGCLDDWRARPTRWSRRCEVRRWRDVSWIVALNRSLLHVIMAEWIFALGRRSQILLGVTKTGILAMQETVRCLLLHRNGVVVVGILTWHTQLGPRSAQIAQVLLLRSQQVLARCRSILHRHFVGLFTVQRMSVRRLKLDGLLLALQCVAQLLLEGLRAQRIRLDRSRWWLLTLRPVADALKEFLICRCRLTFRYINLWRCRWLVSKVLLLTRQECCVRLAVRRGDFMIDVIIG